MFPYVMSTTLVPESDTCTLLDNPLVDVTQWARGIKLSCGTNDVVDLRSTIHHVVCSLLRQYRANMPHAAWQRRCRDFLRKLEIMVGRKRYDGTPGRVLPAKDMHWSSQKAENLSSASGGSDQATEVAWIVAPEELVSQGSSGGDAPSDGATVLTGGCRSRTQLSGVQASYYTHIHDFSCRFCILKC